MSDAIAYLDEVCMRLALLRPWLPGAGSGDGTLHCLGAAEAVTIAAEFSSDEV